MALTRKNIETLAELMYMKEAKKDDKEWKDLPQAQKDKQIAIVNAFIDNMAKLEYVPRPVGEAQVSRAKLRATELDLTNFIKDFIQQRVKVPANLIQVFPYGELAAQIAKAFIDKKDTAQADKKG